MNDYAKYSSIAIQTIAIILLGVYGGVKLDKKLESSPCFTLIFSILAVGLALYAMIKKITK